MTLEEFIANNQATVEFFRNQGDTEEFILDWLKSCYTEQEGTNRALEEVNEI